jgi:hypothetical protein
MSPAGTSRRDDYLQQQYFTFTQNDLSRFFGLVNGLRLAPVATCSGVVLNEDCSESGSRRWLESKDERVINEIQAFLNQKLSIHWAKFVPDLDACPSSGAPGSRFDIEAKSVSQSRNRR